MSDEYIEIAASDGSGTFSAYLALPASGQGPGLVLAQEIFGINASIRALADAFAEEGYVVAAPDLFWRQAPGVELGWGEADMARAFALYEGFSEDKGVEDLAATAAILRARQGSGGKVGCVGFCLGGKLAWLAACRAGVDVAVGYYGVGIENNLAETDNIKGRLVLHLAELDGFCPPAARETILAALAGRPATELYVYPGVDHAFARPGGDHFDKTAASLAHQRTVAALKATMGPAYDLAALWDNHCDYEFGVRDVAATMATMVAEPYVNHVPTMTGGIGHADLERFYRDHFVNGNPPDTKLTPVSRTIGATQIVDEMLFSFTHTREIDWMLPGAAPTGKFVEVPLVAIVRFRGDKLAHEHIYWDQASVLAQLGLIDPAKLPVAGAETARKLVDETLPSNRLMKNW